MVIDGLLCSPSWQQDAHLLWAPSPNFWDFSEAAALRLLHQVSAGAPTTRRPESKRPGRCWLTSREEGGYLQVLEGVVGHGTDMTPVVTRTSGYQT
jgi:hypothetical protein